ncbi:MAG: hypothetical protein K2L87_05235, partial [Clostridiales bacterium]|nr:hypothetical protein [Clostridiales bacterium]
MRVCIYGAGAMGTSFGVLLQKRSGIKIDFITRNQSRVQLLNTCGATVVGVAEGERVYALLPSEMDGEYDFIFLATKQRENEKTAEFLSAHLKENGALITLQNGLPEPLLAEVLGEDRVYCGVLSWGAEIAEGGSANITSNAGYHVGLGAYGSGERLFDIERLLTPAFEVTTGNLFELRFAKLATNASFSTLSVLSGLPFGIIAKKYKKYATKLIRETFNVARAYGCKKLPLNGHDLFKVLTLFGGRLLPRAMKHYRET